MSDPVKNWLERTGLGEFAEAFARNHIGFDLLRRLDSDELKELGLSVGQRRRYLDAVALLESGGFDVDESKSQLRAEAERRQLTIMFCDLVGSTQLSQALDVEDLRQVIRAHQEACTAAIKRFGGYVARYMGDGILAYFGYPKGHEDDAERAVHAGLEVVDSIARLSRDTGKRLGIDLRVRVGIATGPVVVGDLVGEGVAQENAVIGETPNLAARLQALAPGDTVLIGPATHDLVVGRFNLDPFGEHELKGIAEPIPTWRVMAPMVAESRFDTLHGARLTPLVGREHEIGLLLERWEQSVAGDGQVVLISGEAGIGKSRMAAALRQRSAGGDLDRLRYQCSPYHTNSALHPIVEQLERMVDFRGDDTPDRKHARIEAMVGQWSEDASNVAPVFASLLSVPVAGAQENLTREDILSTLADQVEGLSRRAPLLIVFEDVHWADPTSIELLESLIERLQRIPVLLIITFRPEFVSPWGAYSHITTLTLNRFTRAQVATMLDELTGGKRMPPEVRRHIIDHADGVPLYVEELTTAIAESGVLAEENGEYVLQETLADIVIPVTLQDSLTARLDSLGGGKWVAQAGAAIGREFSRDLLALVCDIPHQDFDAALAELVRSGLLFRRGRGADVGYVFKHALVQGAAYETLLHSTRRDLHRRIADALLSRSPDVAETQPELVAHHLVESGRLEASIVYWLRAGQRASMRSAHHEAIAHLNRGLEIVQDLPDSESRLRQELDLHLGLIIPLGATQFWTSQLIEDNYERTQQLCELLGDTEHFHRIMFGPYSRHLLLAEHREASALAARLLSVAERQQDTIAIMHAHRWLCWPALLLGDLPVVHEHINKMLALYDSSARNESRGVSGVDARVAGLCCRAYLEWLIGYPERAKRTSQDAIALSREFDDVGSLIYALFIGGAQPAAMWRDWQAAGDMSQEQIRLADEHGAKMYLGWGRVTSAWVQGKRGDRAQAVSELREAIEHLITAGQRVWAPLYYTLLADLNLDGGESGAAIKALDKARQLVEETDERVWLAEIHRGYATAALADGDSDTATTNLNQAIDISRTQGARSLELRAATALAQLWHEHGKTSEARALLKPLRDWFTEGTCTPDLADADALLNRL